MSFIIPTEVVTCYSESKSNPRLSAVDAPSNNSSSPLTSDGGLHAAKKATNWLALRGLRKGLCCTKTRTSGERQQQRKSKSQCTFLGLAVTFLSINIIYNNIIY